MCWSLVLPTQNHHVQHFHRGGVDFERVELGIELHQLRLVLSWRAVRVDVLDGLVAPLQVLQHGIRIFCILRDDFVFLGVEQLRLDRRYIGMETKLAQTRLDQASRHPIEINEHSNKIAPARTRLTLERILD